MRLLLAVLLLAASAHAQFDLQQFDLQDSHSTASLRGIDTPAPGIAWASGSGGTILRTEDGGYLWQGCATPKGAEKLDFRGIQALDAQTAVVMSSGKGKLSRIYKTTDGCQTWKLVFTNPDPEGFFDAIRRVTAHQFYVLGDPVGGPANARFALFLSTDTGDTWSIAADPGLEAEKGDGAFAASNTSLLASGATLFFGTGGAGNPHVYSTSAHCAKPDSGAACPVAWSKTTLPLAAHSPAAGVFSLAARGEAGTTGRLTTILVAVGGTYDKPDDKAGTAATSKDGGRTWNAATNPPSGYRSAVAFDREQRLWIAVGTNGADLSKDDGHTWSPLGSGESAAGWNAIALPYVVGVKGRIAKVQVPKAQP